MRVLFLGETPETADFSDPALPPGLTAEKIRAGVDKAMADLGGRGWQATACMVPPSIDQATTQLRAALATGPFDCVVIGGGLRLPVGRVTLFEALMNLLRREAPGTPLAFNTGPETTVEAAARQLGG